MHEQQEGGTGGVDGEKEGRSRLQSRNSNSFDRESTLSMRSSAQSMRDSSQSMRRSLTASQTIVESPAETVYRAHGRRSGNDALNGSGRISTTQSNVRTVHKLLSAGASKGRENSNNASYYFV